MNRVHPPCAACAHFITAGHPGAVARGEGWCDAWEAYKPATGQTGPLFLERGSRAAAEAARTPKQMLAELRQRHPRRIEETISRASATT